MSIKHIGLLIGACIAPRAQSSSFHSLSSSFDLPPARAACLELQTRYPAATYFSNTSSYETDNTDFWSQSSALGPACVFAPSLAEQLGEAVKVLTALRSPFAMRGGGHMPIGDFNNINSTGVLLSSSGFKRLEMAADGESVHVGPGNHWSDVYEFLEPHGKVVVGGRLGIVGIPGFVTGGGASFFSAEYGWASNNVRSYTVVLANGSVVRTSEDSLPDLFWALRGGGNSFALVTDLELKTYDVPVVTVGIATHDNTTTSSSYYNTLVDFALQGQIVDEKASVIPIVNTGSTAPVPGAVSYTTYRFWGGNASSAFENASPPSLSYFTEPRLGVASDTFAPKTMHGWSEETAPSFARTQGLRQRFYTPLTLRVTDKAEIVSALEIIHDTYFGAVFSALSGLDLWFTGMSPFPISKQFLAASAERENSIGGIRIPKGDPMGLSSENLIVVELSLSYSNNATYEPIVTEFLHAIGREIREALCGRGLEHTILPWIYLNDADKGQDVFGGYPAKNVQVLQKIREKYDPDRVFTDLMPGGWKVAYA